MLIQLMFSFVLYARALREGLILVANLEKMICLATCCMLRAIVLLNYLN